MLDRNWNLFMIYFQLIISSRLHKVRSKLNFRLQISTSALNTFLLLSFSALKSIPKHLYIVISHHVTLHYASLIIASQPPTKDTLHAHTCA